MILHFEKLETNANFIKISWDGVNWIKYDAKQAKEKGIQFNEKICPDLTKIKIRGSLYMLYN